MFKNKFEVHKQSFYPQKRWLFVLLAMFGLLLYVLDYHMCSKTLTTILFPACLYKHMSNHICMFYFVFPLPPSKTTYQSYSIRNRNKRENFPLAINSKNQH